MDEQSKKVNSKLKKNANQNHNEVPLHTSQNGCDPKICKQ